MTVHLITGGAGFVGARMARRLWEQGEQVRVIDVLRDPSLPKGIEFQQASICDSDAVARAMTGVDVLHHYAALVAQSDAGREYHAVNVEGSRVVTEEAIRAGVGIIVHLSSTSVYGLTPPGPITMDTVPQPLESYGRSKLASEKLMDRLCREARLPLITIRPRVTLGEGRLGIYQILFDWIAESRRLFIIGDGGNRMQFIHVEDLVDFIQLALTIGEGGVYNVGTDTFGTLREDLQGLIAHAGSGSRITALPVRPAIAALATLRALRLSPLVPWQYRTYHRDCYFDVSPLLALGWRPRYSNAAMLADSYDAYREWQPDACASAHRSPLPQQAIGLLRRLS